MARVDIEKLSKIFHAGKGGEVCAVRQVTLAVADGEFLVLVGPSGCGKSTTLRLIAGLEEISGGTISIDGRVVNGVAPKDRDVAMVFQNYALYPHLTVFENMGLGLVLRKFPRGKSSPGSGRRRNFLAWAHCWTGGRASFPAVSGSGWRWGAR